MKKIAILTCLEACKVCAGVGCLEAWNEKKSHFSMYAEEEAQLVAFLHCNGCDSDPATDPGMLEKLDRLQSIGVDTVHTGVCAMKDWRNGIPCPVMEKVRTLLHQRDIQTVHGTH